MSVHFGGPKTEITMMVYDGTSKLHFIQAHYIIAAGG